MATDCAKGILDPQDKELFQKTYPELADTFTDENILMVVCIGML